MNEENFFGLGIAPAVLEALSKLKFTKPTPIQARSIPTAIEGKDLIGVAQTGTGKTLAFGIPLVQTLINNKGLGLVIAPTRELASQIDDVLKKLGGELGLKTVVLIGGESIEGQFRGLKAAPQIIIGTPGRILDHIERRSVSLSSVRVLVLDEADRMLDMGFMPQLRRIMNVLPRERQTMLFSATIPEEIMKIAKNYLKLPLRVEVSRSGSTSKDIVQELFIIAQEDKPRLLKKILDEYRGSVLTFCRTRHAAGRVASFVRSFGHTSAEIHSDRSLGQRREALAGFKSGKYRVLVATDIAARGIDVKNIELVINYDLPKNPEDYVHRIGRTGRAGLSGHAISFALPDQKKDVVAIESLTRSYLPSTKLPELPEVQKLPRRNFLPNQNRFSPRNKPSSNPRPRTGGSRRG